MRSAAKEFRKYAASIENDIQVLLFELVDIINEKTITLRYLMKLQLLIKSIAEIKFKGEKLFLDVNETPSLLEESYSDPPSTSVSSKKGSLAEQRNENSYDKPETSLSKIQEDIDQKLEAVTQRLATIEQLNFDLDKKGIRTREDVVYEARKFINDLVSKAEARFKSNCYNNLLRNSFQSDISSVNYLFHTNELFKEKINIVEEKNISSNEKDKFMLSGESTDVNNSLTPTVPTKVESPSGDSKVPGLPEENEECKIEADKKTNNNEKSTRTKKLPLRETNNRPKSSKSIKSDKFPKSTVSKSKIVLDNTTYKRICTAIKSSLSKDAQLGEFKRTYKSSSSNGLLKPILKKSIPTRATDLDLHKYAVNMAKTRKPRNTRF